MEERTAQKLISSINELKAQQSDMWKKMVGDPTEGKLGTGIIARLDKIEEKIEKIEKNGIKIRWFWMGASAAGGAGGYAGIKALLAKLGWIASQTPVK